MNHIDPAVFNVVVNYLKRTTGKPVITNEFGVLNTSPILIQELMQQVLNTNMDYAIFYSGDGAGGSKLCRMVMRALEKWEMPCEILFNSIVNKTP